METFSKNKMWETDIPGKTYRTFIVDYCRVDPCYLFSLAFVEDCICYASLHINLPVPTEKFPPITWLLCWGNVFSFRKWRVGEGIALPVSFKCVKPWKRCKLPFQAHAWSYFWCLSVLKGIKIVWFDCILRILKSRSDH